eukprot:GFYU01019378.1.p1 GENE.GFYU01019378.1~~GFYU01019378.1.p1  ORF type:complete len:264 (-),score=43.38 GFYU01019378.1:120-911(-)
MAVPRIICHVDLDCFFVQVERKKKPSLVGIPVAVHQHADVICVSYEARALGVLKHDTPEKAVERLPSLRLVHVPLLEYGRKVSYRDYQDAGAAVSDIIKEHVGAKYFEPAGMDESYIDLTSLAMSRANKRLPVTDCFREDVVIYGESEWPCNQGILEYAFAHAVAIVNRIRDDVYRRLGYVMSAGLGHSKAFAKLASAKFKPNKTAVVHPMHIQRLLAETPIRKLPKMKSKTGDLVLEKYPHLKMASPCPLKQPLCVNAWIHG